MVAGRIDLELHCSIARMLLRRSSLPQYLLAIPEPGWLTTPPREGGPELSTFNDLEARPTCVTGHHLISPPHPAIGPELDQSLDEWIVMPPTRVRTNRL